MFHTKYYFFQVCHISTQNVRKRNLLCVLSVSKALYYSTAFMVSNIYYTENYLLSSDSTQNIKYFILRVILLVLYFCYIQKQYISLG